MSSVSTCGGDRGGSKETRIQFVSSLFFFCFSGLLFLLIVISSKLLTEVVMVMMVLCIVQSICYFSLGAHATSGYGAE